MCHFALALEDVHVYRRLAIRRGGEDLALFRGDGGVALNQLGEYAAHGLNAQGQRGNIQQQHVCDVAAEYAALDGRADGHAFVRVDALERLFAGDALDGILHGRDTGGAADQDDLADVLSGQAGVLDGLQRRAHGLLDQVRGQLVEFGAGERHIHMACGPEASAVINGRLMLVSAVPDKLDLCLFRRFLQALHGHVVACDRSMPSVRLNSATM